MNEWYARTVTSITYEIIIKNPKHLFFNFQLFSFYFIWCNSVEQEFFFQSTTHYSWYKFLNFWYSSQFDLNIVEKEAKNSFIWFINSWIGMFIDFSKRLISLWNFNLIYFAISIDLKMLFKLLSFCKCYQYANCIFKLLKLSREKKAIGIYFFFLLIHISFFNFFK